MASNTAAESKLSFFDRLEARVNTVNSLLCVGLDPHRADLEKLGDVSANGAFTFCASLVDKTKHIAVSYKPNGAFFEAFGADGIAALEKLISYVPDDIPVLLDIKRGDIGSTAVAYADAAYNSAKADAVTLSPYMGSESISPFIKNPEKGGVRNQHCVLVCPVGVRGMAPIPGLFCPVLAVRQDRVKPELRYNPFVFLPQRHVVVVPRTIVEYFVINEKTGLVRVQVFPRVFTQIAHWRGPGTVFHHIHLAIVWEAVSPKPRVQPPRLASAPVRHPEDRIMARQDSVGEVIGKDNKSWRVQMRIWATDPPTNFTAPSMQLYVQLFRR